MVTRTQGALTRAFAEPGEVDRNTLGGKGFGLVEMTRAGLRVPPGYVISTQACHDYLEHGSLTDALRAEIFARLEQLEAETGKRFGGADPLLLSVRSGAPVSMPGMMDTVLNLGLGREAAIALAQATGDTVFMAEVLFRFHAMYAETVLGALDVAEPPELDELLRDNEIDAAAEPGRVYDLVWELCADRLRDDIDEEVPTDPRDQLIGAVEAVFRSWNTRRAVTYREVHKIPHTLGTAVVVQSMVFGNLDERSGSGVVFTRNPVSGEPGLFGEYLAASQGEDVVAGTRTPDPVASLAERLPDVYAELEATCAELERSRADVLDIEFTVERGVLYLLQVRSAKRTAQAAIRIAADLLAEGLATPAEALAAISLDQVRQVQRPGFDAADLDRARADGRFAAAGVGASPGHVVGALYFDSDAAQQAAKQGVRVILARPVTSPTDLHGMIAADGILTATGGSTSHAAVVARALGTTCIVGCSALDIDPGAGTMRVAGHTLSTGDVVALDGATGDVILGEIALSEPAAEDGRLAGLLELAARESGATMLAAAATVEQVRSALDKGVHGLVAGVDDVLAAAGRFDEILQALAGGEAGTSDIADLLERCVTEEFTALFEAAGGREFGVRSIDFRAADAAEMLGRAELFVTQHPELGLPLGASEIVSAQLRGIVAAASGTDTRVHFVVRGVTSPAEIDALVALRDGLGVEVGGYLDNLAGLSAAETMPSQVQWIGLREVQASLLGLARGSLATAEPLDGYLRRGLLPLDPRTTIEPRVNELLVAALRSARRDGHRIGVRLRGPVSAEIVGTLVAAGFDRVAVDGDEVRPALLALGKARG